MFKFIKVWTKSKTPESPRYRRDFVRGLDGMSIKYVTERHGDNDDVIAKGGALIVKPDEDIFLVYAGSEVIFRCHIPELAAWQLMSGDGVSLTAPDLEHDGVERTIIAYYTYYRK